MFPTPSEVQNDSYASNEDEEDEGEDLEGRKVTVRCSHNLGIKSQGTPKAVKALRVSGAFIHSICLLSPCV